MSTRVEYWPYGGVSVGRVGGSNLTLHCGHFCDMFGGCCCLCYGEEYHHGHPCETCAYREVWGKAK
jgi:hypothetical protein